MTESVLTVLLTGAALLLLTAHLSPSCLLFAGIPGSLAALVEPVTLFGLASMPPEPSAWWLQVRVLVPGRLSVHLVFFGAAWFRLPLSTFLTLAAVRKWQAMRRGTLVIKGRQLMIVVLWCLLLVGGRASELWLLLHLS